MDPIVSVAVIGGRIMFLYRRFGSRFVTQWRCRVPPVLVYSGVPIVARYSSRLPISVDRTRRSCSVDTGDIHFGYRHQNREGNMWFYFTNFAMFITIVVFLAYVYTRRKFAFWARRGVAFQKPHWIFGSFVESYKEKISIGEDVMKFYRKFKGERFGGVWEFFSPKLIVIEPRLLSDIFTKDFEVWSSRGIVVNEDVDPLAAHLVNLHGKKWKKIRSTLTPAFTQAKLKLMHTRLVQCAKEFEEYVREIAEKNEPVEAKEMSAKFTTDAIGWCIFGIRTNSLSNENAVFRMIGRKIFESSYRKRLLTVLQKSLPGVFQFFKFSKHPKQLTDFFLKITKESIESRKNNNTERADFMDMLISLKNSDKPQTEDDIQFTDEMLAAQIYGFFGAGFETSATTMSYCLHELAVNPEIQMRLRDEIREQKNEDGGEITWNSLRDMKYLDMVIQETLRKYPPIPVIGRTCNKRYKIPNTDIELPARTGCYIPVLALHHDPDYYPDPDKFDPLRFTEEAKKQRPAFTFLPFGEGQRICIGLRFADQQMKLAIVNIIDQCEVSLCEKSQNPLRFEPTSRFLVPKDGVWIRLRPHLHRDDTWA